MIAEPGITTEQDCSVASKIHRIWEMYFGAHSVDPRKPHLTCVLLKVATGGGLELTARQRSATTNQNVNRAWNWTTRPASPSDVRPKLPVLTMSVDAVAGISGVRLRVLKMLKTFARI